MTTDTPRPASEGPTRDEKALDAAVDAFYRHDDRLHTSRVKMRNAITAYLAALPSAPVTTPEPVVAWMTHGKLPNKHKVRTYFTENRRIAENWTDCGMMVISLRGRLYTLDEVSTDPPPHPVPPHTPGWNPVDSSKERDDG